PVAPPPSELDPELARMAQRLSAYSHTSAKKSAKKRIWEDVITQFEAQENPNRPIRKEKTRMLATRTLPQKKSSSSSWMWVAVATIILVLGVAVAFVSNQRPTPPQFGAGINLAQTGIPSPIVPTPLPSATPLVDSPIEGYIPVVTVYVPISWGMEIQADMLTITYWSADRVPSGSYQRIEDVVGRIATTDIQRFLPLINVMTVDGTLAMTGIPHYGTVPPYNMGATPTPLLMDIQATPMVTASATFSPTPASTLLPTFTPSPTFTPTARP
ncbi:MAG TPA: SAF domain-containing protein, partial [Aggregatilineales bacterium]|nr:SAF domain-containing protein [Aggregatilineales bacterium]